MFIHTLILILKPINQIYIYICICIYIYIYNINTFHCVSTVLTDSDDSTGSNVSIGSNGSIDSNDSNGGERCRCCGLIVAASALIRLFHFIKLIRMRRNVSISSYDSNTIYIYIIQSIYTYLSLYIYIYIIYYILYNITYIHTYIICTYIYILCIYHIYIHMYYNIIL